MIAVNEKDKGSGKVFPDVVARAQSAAPIIAENRGTEIRILDLRKVTQAFDFFVIATGVSRRQLHAISDDIDHYFEKELGDHRRGIEGYQESRWIVLDYGDLVVHLFEPEKREFYALDDLWGKGEEVPLSEEVLHAIPSRGGEVLASPKVDLSHPGQNELLPEINAASVEPNIEGEEG